MCQNSRDSSRECPLVNFNYSQHAFALIQLNCCGKAEAQLLFAQSNGISGITHNLMQPLYWNQNIILEKTCLFIGRNVNSLSPSKQAEKFVIDQVNNYIITWHVVYSMCKYFLINLLIVCLIHFFHNNFIYIIYNLYNFSINLFSQVTFFQTYYHFIYLNFNMISVNFTFSSWLHSLFISFHHLIYFHTHFSHVKFFQMTHLFPHMVTFWSHLTLLHDSCIYTNVTHMTHTTHMTHFLIQFIYLHVIYYMTLLIPKTIVFLFL